MKPLSQLIEEGSKILKPVPFRRRLEDGKSGCALGMAEMALGIKWPETVERMPGYEWSKAYNKAGPKFSYPCGCSDAGYSPVGAVAVIAHLFNYHVCREELYDSRLSGYTTLPPWTMEQLVAWVREVEPKEAA